MLTPTLPAQTSCRLLYTGQVGTAGVAAAISINLTALPGTVLSDPNFRDNWRVFVKQVGEGITDVDEAIDFTPASPAVPTAMVLTVAAAATTDILDLEAVFTPTSVR